MSVGLPIRNSKNDCFVPVSQNEAGDFLYASSVEDDEVPPIDTTTLAGKFVYAQWTKYKVLGEEIDCKWGQRYPYNIYTKTASGENAPVGCVATAVAQILYYWGVNFTMDGVSFDWNLMRKHKSNTNSYSKAYDMVAKLFYELGLKKNLDMKYTENASGAPNENTYRTFKACGLSSGGVMEDYKWDRILDVIGERPIYICGYSNYTTELDENGNEKVIKIQNGHAWVVDKVKFRKRPKIKYNEKGVGKVVGYQHERLVHCNFGWNGACDGYYYSGKFDTKSGPVTKSTIDYGEDYFYQFYLTINCGIYK